jgi:hypothetical protein
MHTFDVHRGTREVAMSLFSGLVWLVTFGRVSRASSTEDDRAGMGTAFGLDASMVPAETLASDSADSPQRAAPPWEHRLIRRSSL